MIWFTADHHYGHANIIKFQEDTRPFSSIEEHDEFGIKMWNEQVSPSDDVYYLGDFTLRDWKFASSVIKRLNGSINFIYGGHDHRWYYDVSASEMEELNITLLGELTTIFSPTHKLQDKYPLPIVLCHYAMLRWDRSHFNSLHLFGHSHGKLENPSPNSMDIGIDTSSFKLYSIDEVVTILGETGE